MNESPSLRLERDIHSLLCGALGEAERRKLLLRIAREQPARRLLEEMLTCQAGARTAFGYDRADATMQVPLKRLQESLAAREASHRPALPARPSRSHRLGVGTWVWRVAASIVLAASVVGAWTAYVSSRQTRDRLTAIDAKATLAQMTAGEIAGYRRIWNEIVGPADELKPWILLSDGVGRFEYLPAAARRGGQDRFVLLRCLVVSSDASERQVVNLLLPADRPVRASLGEAGRLAGRTIRCSVATEDEWVAVDLRVGDDQAGAAGVQGRVRLGDQPSEIGRFRLAGTDLRVFLQALPLARGVG